MDALNGSVVRSIDLGYGNVKFVLQHTDMMSEIECGLFPSRSPAAGEKTLAAGLVSGRDTVVITVDGFEYEVGYGVAKAQGTFDESANLDKEFCLSPAYMARLCGALYYMMGSAKKSGPKYFEGNVITTLAVGLPVATFRNKSLREKLQNLVVGKHELPDGRTVTIENAVVLPQPLGSFYEYAFVNGLFETMREQNNLILDPGFFTFDWLTTAGTTPIDARSDSVPRGMSAVIKAIVEYAKKKEGWDADTGMLSRMLDEHFRSGRPFAVYGTEYDVSKYLGAGRAVINEAVSALGNSVGDGVDIQNIIIGGGGAKIYLDALQERFPRHKIKVMDNPVFSNVRGFQLACEQNQLRQNRVARMARANI